MILSAVRTPVGRYGGGLAEVRPDDLAATAIAAAVERSGVPAEEIEDVWFGCANQAGEDNRNVARMGALLAGLPESVAGVTVNRLCASGLAAVARGQGWQTWQERGWARWTASSRSRAERAPGRRREPRRVAEAR